MHKYLKKVIIACFCVFTIMLRTKKLTEFEKEQIVALSLLRLNSQAIMIKIERS